jgi:hypothetical protein
MLFQLRDYLLFVWIGFLLGNLLHWASASFGTMKEAIALSFGMKGEDGYSEDKTHDLSFPAALSTTAPASFSTLAALTSASPSF